MYHIFFIAFYNTNTLLGELIFIRNVKGHASGCLESSLYIDRNHFIGHRSYHGS